MKYLCEKSRSATAAARFVCRRIFKRLSTHFSVLYSGKKGSTNVDAGSLVAVNVVSFKNLMMPKLCLRSTHSGTQSMRRIDSVRWLLFRHECVKSASECRLLTLRLSTRPSISSSASCVVTASSRFKSKARSFLRPSGSPACLYALCGGVKLKRSNRGYDLQCAARRTVSLKIVGLPNFQIVKGEGVDLRIYEQNLTLPNSLL